MDVWMDEWVREYMQEFCSENGTLLAREVCDGLLEKAAFGLRNGGFGRRLVKVCGMRKELK